MNELQFWRASCKLFLPIRMSISFPSLNIDIGCAFRCGGRGTESLKFTKTCQHVSQASQYLAALAGKGPRGWGKKSIIVNFTRGKKCWISVAHSTPMKPAPTTNTVAPFSFRLFRKLNLTVSQHWLGKSKAFKTGSFKELQDDVIGEGTMSQQTKCPQFVPAPVYLSNIFRVGFVRYESSIC